MAVVQTRLRPPWSTLCGPANDTMFSGAESPYFLPTAFKDRVSESRGIPLRDRVIGRSTLPGRSSEEAWPRTSYIAEQDAFNPSRLRHKARHSLE